MKPGKFKGFIDAIAGHMSALLKTKGGPMMSKALRTYTKPDNPEPQEPGIGASRKENLNFEIIFQHSKSIFAYLENYLLLV